jgi:diaminopimelate decarboxylase
LEWAGKTGIYITVADTIDELKKIKKLAPHMKILWRIAVKES